MEGGNEAQRERVATNRGDISRVGERVANGRRWLIVTIQRHGSDTKREREREREKDVCRARSTEVIVEVDSARVHLGRERGGVREQTLERSALLHKQFNVDVTAARTLGLKCCPQRACLGLVLGRLGTVVSRGLHNGDRLARHGGVHRSRCLHRGSSGRRLGSHQGRDVLLATLRLLASNFLRRFLRRGRLDYFRDFDFSLGDSLLLLRAAGRGRLRRGSRRLCGRGSFTFLNGGCWDSLADTLLRGRAWLFFLWRCNYHLGSSPDGCGRRRGLVLGCVGARFVRAS